MLRQDGIPPISRNKPRRGNMRGGINSDDESRPRGRDKRSVHFEEQQTKSSAPVRGGTRGGRGLPAPRGSTATSRASSAAKEPGKRGGFTQQIANHIQGQPSGRRNIPPTGDHAAYQERFNQLKKSRERERTAAIANGTFADPNKRVTLAEAITPVGTCRDMCPEFERVRRTVQRDVWPEERDESKPDAGPMNRLPDESRMVKKFTRSAAGQEEQLPSDLRPPEVLKLTIDYLFDTLIGNAPRLADVHHFVWDRTRAIRNDFSIQQVSKNDDVRIAMDTYERIARFHILSMHILAEKENQYTEYNAQQEREQLDKTILSLVDYYEDNKDRVQSPNEAEFRAYQILFQIQSPQPNLEDRLQDWSKRVQQDPRVHTALRIYTAACSIANPQGPLKPYTSHEIAQSHWGSFWNLVSSPEVSYLMGCVSEIYFPMLRRKALHSLWQAYRPRAGRAPSSEWTLDELRPVLGMQTEDEVADYCEQCGFTIKEHADGPATLDLGSVIGGLSDIGNSQVFTKLVDDKKEGRSLSAVMNGIEDKTQQVQMENADEDSLFVPENASASQQGSTKQQGLFASSSQPASASNTSPFSRPQTTNTPPHQTWSPETGIKFGSSSTQSPFAPSNNTANQAQPPHIPAQPVFAPSLSSTSNPFGVPANFGLPKQDNATSTALGNAPKSLFDRTSDSGSTPTAPASSTLPSQSSLFHNTGTPLAISGSSNPFGAASSFPTPSKTTPNAPSLSSAQPTPNVAEQHPGSATQATRQVNSNSLFAHANQQTSSAVPPQLSSDQQPSSTLFTNALNQKPSSDSHAPLQPVSASLASDQEAIAKQAAVQQAKAEDRKRAAETEQRRRDAEKREAEEQEQRAKQLASHVAAQRKAQREKTLDDLTRSLLLGPNGFLSQYIEYNVGPLIEATQNQVQQERLMKEADQFRVSHVMGRYGRKWRDVCWKRRLARQGRERRQRKQRDAEARRRREQNTNISAEMEAFRNSADSNQTSPATSTHRRLSNEPQQSQTESMSGGRGLSSSREPDLASSLASANRRSSNNNDRDSAASVSADHSLQSTHKSSRSVFATPRQHDIRAQRKDTTRSDYFRLKVMGIQPPPNSLPPAKPASGYRATGLKRLRESDSYVDLHRSAGSSIASRDLNASTTQNSMPPPSKRPASQVEVESNMKSSTSTASSLDQQDEDDALLEQVRQAQKAMRESIDFFRGEMDEMKRESTRTSRSNSVDNQSRALARVGLESAPRSRDRTGSDADKVSTRFDGAKSERAAAPPLKYRSRVSKFLPREEYADMRMLRDGHHGASPRPSSKLSPSVRAPRKSHESVRASPAADPKPSSPDPHGQTHAQSKERSPLPRPPQANGTNNVPPASLASSQSHHPSETFVPGSTLGTLINNSTKPSTSSPAFAATPASTSFGFASKLTPNGDSSNQNKTTNDSASTSFISESSVFQPAGSSSFSIRPETPQFAPQSSSPFVMPKTPTLGVSAQNGANAQTQQTFQAHETIAYPKLPSSSPGLETGTQRHERLLGTAGKGTRNATPISPPRLSQRRKRDLEGDDHDATIAARAAQGQAGGAFIAQNTVKSKRQKREKRIANQRANAFALLADRDDDDDDDDEDEGQSSDSSREDDHDNMIGDEAVKDSVDAAPTKGFKHPNPNAHGSDAPSLPHPGQGNDFGTSSLDGNSHGDSDESENDDESEDEIVDDEQGFDDDAEGRRFGFDDEEDEVEDNDSSVSSSNDNGDDDDDDSQRDANIINTHTNKLPASKPARDFGGKTGASVEDAIEL